MKKIFIIIGIIVAILVGIAVILLSTLNKEKTPISAETFKTTMDEKGFVITDATSQFAQYEDIVSKVYIAQKSGYQIEFYELSNEENAITMYSTNKAKFELQEGNASTSSNISAKNYATYSLTTNGKYKYVSRIDNTVIYMDVDTDYKDDVKDIMKEIGY